jgi:hypothetical protein
MATKLAQQMTRVVAIGTIKDMTYTTEPFAKLQGNLDTGNGSIARFTIFNNEKADAKSPHTKALDFSNQYKVGDKVYINGQDNRSYSAEKERHYEDIMVWDYRDSSPEETSRLVFVYVMDVLDISEDEILLQYTNFKKVKIEFPIAFNANVDVSDLEIGDRVKTKGTMFSGFVSDFFGDGEFATTRTAVGFEIVNSADEIEEATSETVDDSKLW